MRDVQKTQYFNILYFRTSNGIIRDNLVFDTLRIKQVPQPLINSGAVALYAVCMKYSNVLSLLTFFLNSFHFPFCYKLIVRPESTCLMKVIRYLLALIYRYKSLFFYICKFYVS